MSNVVMRGMMLAPCLVVASGLAQCAETSLDWEPHKTHVFVVGVLKWEHENLYPGMWDVESIFTTIDEKFRGSRALLLADCCHSGALYDQAHPRRDGRIAYSVVTSSYSHNTSTGRWTFTDSVLAALRGEGTADQNADGVIDLAELARYCELEMAFGEG